MERKEIVDKDQDIKICITYNRNRAYVNFEEDLKSLRFGLAENQQRITKQELQIEEYEKKKVVEQKSTSDLIIDFKNENIASIKELEGQINEKICQQDKKVKELEKKIEELRMAMLKLKKEMEDLIG